LLSELLAPIAVLLEETKGLKGPGEVKEGEGKTEKGSTACFSLLHGGLSQSSLSESLAQASLFISPWSRCSEVWPGFLIVSGPTILTKRPIAHQETKGEKMKEKRKERISSKETRH